MEWKWHFTIIEQKKFKKVLATYCWLFWQVIFKAITSSTFQISVLHYVIPYRINRISTESKYLNIDH